MTNYMSMYMGDNKNNYNHGYNYDSRYGHSKQRKLSKSIIHVV
jgi:hypothetical protein